MKEKIQELLNQINRNGIEDLKAFLESSDFYEAPASTRYHGAYKGGLIEHSYKVYEILKDKIKFHSNSTDFNVTLMNENYNREVENTGDKPAINRR